MRRRTALKSLTQYYEERGLGCDEERFVISTKQKAALDKWEKKDAAKLAEENAGDVTTEEEESNCSYDADYSI